MTAYDERTVAPRQPAPDPPVVAFAAAGLALVAVCYGLARFAYGLFVPAFRDAFALDAATAGVIASSSYVSYCVAVLLATLLSPRLGSRAVATLAGLLATAGTAAIALAPGTVVLAVGVVVAGASTGLASPPLAQAVTAVVAGPRRDRVQAIVNSGTGLGVLVSGPVALVAQDQWRAAWLVFAGLAAAVTVWSHLTVPAARPAQDPQDPQDERAEGQPRAARPRLLPSPLLPDGAPRLLLAAALLGAASAATWTFGRDLLATVGGLDDRTSALVWLLLGGVGLLGAGAGDLARRLGLGRSWCVLMVAMGLATGLLALAPDRPVVAAVAAAVFGAGYIALSGLLLIWGTRVYDGQPAAGVGLAFLVLALGQAAAAPVLGIVIDLAGARAAFGGAALLALAGSHAAGREG